MNETTETTPTPPPERIGPYLIERELGSGGMGTVYLGRHEETGLQVAIKRLPASLAREPGFVARFHREIDALHKLRNPHIVELYESGVDEDIPYYAMEYVEGQTFADLIVRQKRVPWRDVIILAVQVAKALKSAHDTGIIHRDLKPSNLMITSDGIVKLTDFGIAQVFATSKLTVTGGILGTPEYMSPEQSTGRRVTKQSDIYSLGAVMYVMLTGRPPFIGKSALDIAQKHRFSQFDSPRRIVDEIPHWLDEVVCQCLSKKPEDRYPDAYVLSLRLQEIIKKVELRDNEPVEQITDPDAETLAATTPGESVPEPVIGGTLARELIKSQLDEEARGGTLQRLLDNTWVLLGVMVLLALFVVVMAIVNRDEPEELFARGEEYMSRPEGPIWLAARREYFDKLMESDPETWAPRVEPYLAQIEIYETKREVLGKDFDDEWPDSEPAAALKRAIALEKSGRTGEARKQYIALSELLTGTTEYENIRRAAQAASDRLADEEAKNRFAFLDAALGRAGQLKEQGKIEEARRIWRSLLELYDAEPDAADYVQTARDSLADTANGNE